MFIRGRFLKEGSVCFIFTTIWGGAFIGGRRLKEGVFIGGFTVLKILAQFNLDMFFSIFLLVLFAQNFPKDKSKYNELF